MLKSSCNFLRYSGGSFGGGIVPQDALILQYTVQKTTYLSRFGVYIYQDTRWLREHLPQV